jgi:hypothetical protein
MKTEIKRVVDMNKKAFSIIEVIVAIGIFASVIVSIFGLLSIALYSVRSVENETIANNFCETIFGIWDVFPREHRDQPIPIPYMGNFTLSQNRTFFLNENGAITDDSSKAAIKVEYIVDKSNNFNMIDTTFIWPPNAPDGSPVRRELWFKTGYF